MMVLLAEALQQYFFPYLEQVRVTERVLHKYQARSNLFHVCAYGQAMNLVAPLMTSSLHEDVRSFSMVAMPEFIRVVGKYTAPDRQLLLQVEFGLLAHITATRKCIFCSECTLQEHFCTHARMIKPFMHSTQTFQYVLTRVSEALRQETILELIMTGIQVSLRPVYSLQHHTLTCL
jgi:hypothetical protein